MVAQRLAEVRTRITAAAERARRDPGSITLVAVGKNHPPAAVAEAIAAGVTDVGENRVQEAAAKRQLLPPARWHLIGPLQRNKAGTALALFDVMHTCDRLELVERLGLLLERDWPRRRLPVLIEVNIGREPQKSGVLPDQAEALLRAARACPQLDVQGLMAIPPFDSDPETSRPHFRALRLLREELQRRLGDPLPQLSMGMSLDYEVAIAEGATLVRVGTAIYGERG
jgi:hypothetical protein